MFAEPLEEFEVVFFKFPTPGCYSFWNKNVDFPLSLAFLDNDYKIVDIKDLEKQSSKSVSPNSNDVKFVVEANLDTFENFKIKIGDKLVPSGKKLLFEKSKS